MKFKMLLAIALLFSSTVLTAQPHSLQAMDIAIELDGNTPKYTGKGGAACTGQPLLYALAKATAPQAIAINNATSAQGGGQWFSSPAPVTLQSVTFYAFRTTGSPDVSASVVIYPSDVNRLPTGPGTLIGSTVVANDSSPTLADMAQTVTASTPLPLNGDFIVAVENHSPDSMGLVANDYTAGDGQGEYLGSADIGGTWLNGDNISIGGILFDADWLIEPTVDLVMNPTASALPACLSGDTLVTLTGTEPFIESRFFDQFAFAGDTTSNYEWSFDDGAMNETGSSVDHLFTGGGTYNPSVSATLNGWAGVCTATASTVVDSLPTVDFSYTENQLQITFTSAVTNADTLLWDFGDGNLSTLANPTHTYASQGNYEVCLTADNDSLCAGNPGPEPGSAQYCEMVGPVPVELEFFQID